MASTASSSCGNRSPFSSGSGQRNSPVCNLRTRASTARGSTRSCAPPAPRRCPSSARHWSTSPPRHRPCVDRARHRERDSATEAHLRHSLRLACSKRGMARRSQVDVGGAASHRKRENEHHGRAHAAALARRMMVTSSLEPSARRHALSSILRRSYPEIWDAGVRLASLLELVGAQSRRLCGGTLCAPWAACARASPSAAAWAPTCGRPRLCASVTPPRCRTSGAPTRRLGLRSFEEPMLPPDCRRITLLAIGDPWTDLRWGGTGESCVEVQVRSVAVGSSRSHVHEVFTDSRSWRSGRRTGAWSGGSIEETTRPPTASTNPSRRL